MQTETHSIDYVLAQNSTSFFIPPFQRAYAWGRGEIERYFNDVMRIIASEHDDNQKDKLEHFFGTLVIKEEKAGFVNKSIIVDGQQRLTTTLLFLIALRDSTDSQEQKDFITNNYLTNNSSKFQDKIKLKQVTKDWDAYRALVNNQAARPCIIKAAYETLSKLIRNARNTNPEILLEDYITAIQRMNVAVIFLDERPFKGEDPQIIFETLNSLGKPLSLSDLIRNYVLLNMDSDNQSDIYEKIWHPKIEEQLKDNASNFFRDFLQLNECKSVKTASDSNTKEIYAAFKEFVERNYKNHKAFVDDIAEFAALYKWIIQENVIDSISADCARDKEIKELLRNIFHDIKAEAFKPFVMGLLHCHQNPSLNATFSDDALISTLKVIRAYLIRRRVLKLAQGENKAIVPLCRKIDDLVKGKTEITCLLSNLFYQVRLPNDDEIQQNLAAANFYEDFKVYSKFILGKIEEHNTKVAVDFRNPQITIEHIMPQTLSGGWEKSLGSNFAEIHRKYLHNIGNLILTEFNSEMGNAAFESKKEKLKASSLSYRLEIINSDSWGEKEIKRHQKLMINMFLETFPVDDSHRHSFNWNTKEQGAEGFSPLDVNAEYIAKGNMPLKIKIAGNETDVSSWQDVFIQFIKFVKNDKACDFQFVIDNQTELFNRDDVIVSWPTLEKLIEENRKKAGRYKTFDGMFWDKADGLNMETQFIHTNISAATCLMRISNIMNKFGMPESFVNITLK